MRIIIAFVILVLVSVPGFAGERLPLEHFAQLPDVSHLSLSPDGKKIAALVRVDLPDQKGMSVHVIDPATGDKKIVLFSDNTTYVIYNLYWKDNLTLLVHGFAPLERKTWGHGVRSFDKVRETRLLFVNSETGGVTKPFTKMFLSRFEVAPQNLDWVIDTLPDDPKHVLLALYGVVYRVNIDTGAAKAYGKQLNTFFASITDRQHRLRAGYHIDDKTITIRFFDLDTKTWRNLSSFEGVFSEEDMDILGFSENPNELFVATYHNDRKAVFKVNLKDPELKRELILADEKYDVEGSIIYSYAQKRMLGISEGETGGSYFLDKDMQAVQASINKAMPHAKNYLYSFSDDLNRFLVFSTGPNESGTFYLGQKTPLKLDAVAYGYKNLPPEVLSPVSKITYKARDGLEVEGYLTLPKGKEPKGLPTLMFPHGGPISRDSDAFDYWAQFFANRGYAVLQMNFRGSSGQGLAHRNAGLGQWGKEMQDDIEDGARYLIEKGVAKADAIGIVGASYGGYAALMGTVKTPDFYRCSISVNGVSNVYRLVLDERAFWETYNVVDEQIGTGAKNLKEISPVNHAKKIKVPILLIHGESDRQVDIKHSIQMRDRLQQAGKQVEFLSLPNEDHYLSNEENRLNTFRAMESFLDKCLPAE